MPKTITCPSGLVGEIRGLKAKEASILADPVAQRKGATLSNVLASCWLSTVDAGPYAWLNGGPVKWSEILLGDRFFVLLRVRAATFGEEYAFKVPCGSCSEPIDWELNLSDLPCKELPEEARENLKAGNNRFELTLSDGKKAAYRLLTGADEQKMQALAKAHPSNRPVVQLAARLFEIEGVSGPDRVRYIEDLELAEVVRIGEVLDETDCGVETSIDVECMACGAPSRVQLPFETRDFWLPRKQKTASLPTL